MGLLVVEGRDFSKFIGIVGEIEDVRYENHGKTITGLSFEVKEDWHGLYLPRMVSEWADLLKWYPLNGKYFPAWTLKPSIDEIVYNWEMDGDTGDVFARTDLFGNPTASNQEDLVSMYNELLINYQIMQDRMIFEKEMFGQVVRRLDELGDARLKELLDTYAKFREAVPSSGGGSKKDKEKEKKLDEMLRLLKGAEIEGEGDIDEEEMSAMERAKETVFGRVFGR